MADRIVQLKDKDDNNIFPVASVANAANIRMTDTDPGEGSALEAGNYVAVYGQNGYIETADIADEAITSDKIDFSTFPVDFVQGDGSTIETFGTVLTKTIQKSGKYLILGQIDADQNTGGTGAYLTTEIRINSQVTDQELGALGTNGRVSGIIFAIHTLAVGDVVELATSGSGSWHIRTSRARMGIMLVN